MSFLFKKKETTCKQTTCRQVTTQSYGTVTVTTKRVNADGSTTIETVTQQSCAPSSVSYKGSSTSQEFFNEQITCPNASIAAAPSAAVTNSNTTSINGFTNFQVECLNVHNEFRRTHHANPLELDQYLCQYAQEWANEIANRGVMQHRSNNKFGENIYWSSGMAIDGRAPVVSWYNEIKDYNFRSSGFSSNTGHFTQVVWVKSRKLGVGIAEKGRQVYVVANYDPPGNYQGEYKENVLSA